MIYLDNSATTKPCKEALEAFHKTAEEAFGNPSSVHKMGVAADSVLSAARRTVAECIHAEPASVYFTSGGTMGDNLAIFGAVNPKRGGKIVTTAIEHPAVKNACDALSKQGMTVEYVMPGRDGVVTAEAIEAALTKDTVLVSVMHVNNETGAVMPISEIKQKMRAICPDALFHTDCVQSFGKLPVLPISWGADMISASAHKLHGLRGAGFLYVRKGVRLRPLLYGGGQEKNVAPGTENLPAIAAMAAAIERKTDTKKIAEMAARLRQGILGIDGAYVNSPENGLMHIVNVSFGKIPSEVLTNALSDAGICVSSGSACAAARAEKSYVLRAMGVPAPDSGVRFSLSDMNEMEEIEETCKVLNRIVPVLMQVVR